MPGRLTAALLILAAVLLGDAAWAAAPAHRYFHTGDGVKLHYLEAGEGPTLVFVPGWTMPAAIWQEQIDFFSKNYRVIAFDPRGQGESDLPRGGYTLPRRAEDIGDLLKHLGPEKVVLIGWSLGVMESLAYLDLFGQERVRALVLVDNSIGEGTPPKTSLTGPSFGTKLKKDRKKTTEEFVRSMYRVKRSDEYYKPIIKSSLRIPVNEAIALRAYPYPREYWRDSLMKTDVPVFYAVTERLREQGEILKEKRPRAKVEFFPGAGHALFVDEAEKFNAALQEFLSAEAGAANDAR